MKKTIILALFLLLLSLFAVGCGGDDPTVVFMVDGSVYHEDVLETEDERFEAPKAEPKKEGYYFGGWFYDDGPFAKPANFEELNEARASDPVYLYAKWEVVALRYEEATRTYTVTGLLSGAGSEVVIPKTYGDLPITAIAPSAFRGNSALTSITIPDSVKEIGDYAFAECGGLTEVVLPHSVETLGTSAFATCTKLTSVRLSAAMTEILPETFANCVALRTVNVPAAVKTIGHRAFSGCVVLSEMTLPVGIRTLAGEIFRNTAITEITFGGTVTAWESISRTDFAKESSLTVVHCTNGDTAP